MQAGRLRHAIALQKATESRDALGGVTLTWATQATRQGSISPLRGVELQAAQQTEARVTHKITLRYTPDLSPDATWRLLFGSRIFHVVSILNVDERNRTWEILATEVPT